MRSRSFCSLIARNMRGLHESCSPARRNERQRESEAERLGGLQVDDELNLRGVLDGKIGGFFTGMFADIGRFRCGAMNIEP
jgi:hypothetical protein